MIDLRNNKIDAIRALRQFTLNEFGVAIGLKEAKDAVENMAKAAPVSIVIQTEFLRYLAEMYKNRHQGSHVTLYGDCTYMTDLVKLNPNIPEFKD